MSNSFTWGQRLALIKAYSPTDGVACTALSVTIDELETARTLQASGTISLDDTVVKANATIFEGVKAVASTTRVAATRPAPTPVRSATTTTSTRKPPASASKPERVPKKRGRSGSKIANAFAAIPSEPTDALKFAAAQGVSLAVLRQAKRFDKSPTGIVKVRKDKDQGVLMVWRETETLPPTA